VWVPPGRTFAALEPMTTPTDALVRGKTPLVAPGDAFTARFSIKVASPERE
jgi:galactose mutarotase-like enzyme